MVRQVTVTAEVVLNQPRSEVWQRMKDLKLSKYYVPGLLDCRIMTQQQSGVGASRKVYLKRMVMDETVIEWTEGKGFLLRLHDGEKAPPMFAQAVCRYAIADGNAGQTVFTHSIIYVPRGGWLGAVLDRLLLRRFMSRSVMNVAVGLKKFYESGQPSNKTFLKEEQG